MPFLIIVEIHDFTNVISLFLFLWGVDNIITSFLGSFFLLSVGVLPMLSSSFDLNFLPYPKSYTVLVYNNAGFEFLALSILEWNFLAIVSWVYTFKVMLLERR